MASVHDDDTMDQFQRAALDAVHAARAVLDAAEVLIRDPAAVTSMVDAVRGFVAGSTPADEPAGPGTPGETDRFERIRVD